MSPITPKKTHNANNVQTIGPVPQQCDDIFGGESGAEKIAKQIQIADDLLAQFHAHIAAKEFRQAETLIPGIVESGGGNVDALCEELENAHIKHTNAARERLSDQIALALPKLDLFTGEINAAGNREVTLVWSAASNSKADSYCLVRKELVAPSTVEDGVTLYKGIKDSFVDTTIPIGIPCYYSVFSCYRGRVNKTPNSLDAPIVYTPAIESLDARIDGCSKCAIATLTWALPPYDEAADVSLVLTRDNKRIFVANCNKCHAEKNAQTVETHGMEFVFFVPDGEVVEGEEYRYELTLRVSGKLLEPLVREVAIPKLAELPEVNASWYYQDGRYRLHVEWPNEVSEIRLTAQGMEPLQYTREYYNSNSIFVPESDVIRKFEVQAVRQYTQKIAYGPKKLVSVTGSSLTLYVSIERAKTGMRALLSIWQGMEWGIRVSCKDEDGQSMPIPQINVTIRDQNDYPKRKFSILVGTIRANEFFQFPNEWGVKRGATIDVSITDGSNQVYIKYLTSQVIS